MDKLDKMFQMRERFMLAIKHKFSDAYPDWPIDMSDKASQQAVRDITLKGVEEMFEALAELKNWKSHKLTDVPDVDRDKFLEEVVDAFNYFMAVLVMAGVTSDELYTHFVAKDDIIHDRLNSGY